jgi:aromatic-amino-acid transaminase
MTERPSLFDALSPQPADGLLGLIALHRDDPRPDKIDLGVGVYRDASGATPVFRAIKEAERRLLAEQASKSYLGPEGDIGFVRRLADIVLGPARATSDRIAGLQTPGGTGALRLGAALLALAAQGRTVWMGDPTWPNHMPIMRGAGLTPRLHPYFDARRSAMDFDAMIAALGEAAEGDILLLHGCCHNPTGTGFTIDQWRALTELCNRRGLMPFIDLAYQGLGDGLDEDAAGLHLMLDSVPDALVAYSCDKNFGLYRERVGALWAQAHGASAASVVRDNLHSLTRSLWSMPPDHGAATVRIVLEDTALADDWRRELADMRRRLNDVRRALAATHPSLAPIGTQRGLFAMLPIDGAAVATLRERRGIYMAGSARINLAGLTDRTIPVLADALAPHLPAGD